MSGLAIVSSNATAVAVGAVFGALSRYQVGEMAGAWIAKDPVKRAHLQGLHTAGINIAGSFALGSLAGIPTFTAATSSSSSPLTSSSSSTTAAAASKKTPQFWNQLQGLSPRTKLLLGVGFCGSFTTFSTFSVDVAKWMAEGQLGKAGGYVLANNVGGIMAAAAGTYPFKVLVTMRETENVWINTLVPPE